MVLSAVEENFDPTVFQSTVVQGKPVNAATVLAVVLPTILIIAFFWFYLKPLGWRKKGTLARDLRVADAEASGIPPMEQHDPHHLVAWMRRGSRGRFIDTQGGHGHRPRPRTNHGRFSFFARSSIVPSLSPVSTPPPPYVTRPGTPAVGTPTPDYQFPVAVPPPLAPPRADSGAAVPTVRYFGPGQSISFRSATPGPISPSPLGKTSSSAAALCPPATMRSISDSNTLHPSTAGLPVPSKALVYDRDTPSAPGPSTIVRVKSSPIIPAIKPIFRLSNIIFIIHW